MRRIAIAFASLALVLLVTETSEAGRKHRRRGGNCGGYSSCGSSQGHCGGGYAYSGCATGACGSHTAAYAPTGGYTTGKPTIAPGQRSPSDLPPAPNGTGAPAGAGAPRGDAPPALPPATDDAPTPPAPSPPPTGA